jgi:hypothetical protein
MSNVSGEYIFKSSDHEQETIRKLSKERESLENLMEIKNVLEVGKASALHEQRLGEGTTPYLSHLARRIIYYNEILAQIKEPINRFSSKGGGKRKKKTRKKRRKTRRRKTKRKRTRKRKRRKKRRTKRR